MKTTTIAIANAIRAGVKANFEPDKHFLQLDNLSNLLLDMAASLEMDATCEHTGVADPKDQKMRDAELLGELGWALDQPAEIKS